MLPISDDRAKGGSLLFREGGLPLTLLGIDWEFGNALTMSIYQVDSHVTRQKKKNAVFTELCKRQ
jgi:hypothetical protein